MKVDDVNYQKENNLDEQYKDDESKGVIDNKEQTKNNQDDKPVKTN